ncbi:unnamed protein product [Penicillium salamii]|uniref:Amino acid transporter transmembrane domain-containing protein n=1 Tax=Penicillium salamii TaxID=1612424 RepID=A0A9W4J7Y1_9EURO|nr:unnamed protein product [Penicillium salamii]CAG7980186.1 unnamed protein product [Penicillium salamii]CAG8078789.1 unnamed protein product [Penicillium salamii]CAG8082419.1 unnamed protein product [Penicillium salamii]CAG8237754.1 unnamed protein product [Penicillium salamii]
MAPEKEEPNKLTPVPSQEGQFEGVHHTHDAVFGELTEDGPNYRNVGWIGTVALMTKSMIGIGVLSVPISFDTLGIVPGVIILITIASITTWSDYIVGVFKLRHPEVYSIDDAGHLMFGRAGRIIFGTAFVLYWIFVAGSGMLGISISFNAMSSHGACTAIFVAIAAIIGFTLGSIQTLAKISWMAWVGLIGILTAIFMVTIAVAIQDRPFAAPKDAVWVPDYQIVGNPSFTKGITAVSTLVMAYAGTPGFFPIVSEMRDPTKYTRSLLVCQTIVTVTYLVVGCVVYIYCGSYVASPALGSAGPLVKKVSYGFALPGLIVTTLLVIHMPAKYIFVRILQGSRHLATNTLIHWVTWLGCTVSITVIAYVIASSIPVFNDLVSLVGALLGTLMSFQPMGCMWLYDNWSSGKSEKSVKWMLMVGFSGFVVLSGTFLMVAGTYGSVVSIMESYAASGGSAAWSCADNSNS